VEKLFIVFFIIIKTTVEHRGVNFLDCKNPPSLQQSIVTALFGRPFVLVMGAKKADLLIYIFIGS